ncbi:hypothetical protein MIND_00940500 [Mycena indigotica]|uniref:DUF7053 domain-containing protein n=1 Tax=Mycena indigotica TaxID=2126181 RepID=A0A8H6VZ12_9AGAR|nr:uncharacterized protein MIND_00940500 [Mycena indigotica]KAF7297076.1 hypothetical protein MIND_00940500 [Mycena indigotica]
MTASAHKKQVLKDASPIFTTFTRLRLSPFSSLFFCSSCSTNLKFPIMRFQFTLAILIASVSARPILVDRGIFDKTSVISSTKHINAPVETVIATLHDFPTMINLNPLVTSSVQDPANPNKFTITDKLPLFLGLSIPTTYVATFKTVENGMDTDNSAQAGVSLHNEWRAVANKNGGTDLTETDTLTTNFLLSGIVTKELTESHNKLMDTLAAKLEAKKA